MSNLKESSAQRRAAAALLENVTGSIVRQQRLTVPAKPEGTNPNPSRRPAQAAAVPAVVSPV